MPNQRTRTETNPMPCLHQTPTYVHIIPRRTELWIKPANLRQNRPPIPHVATRNMLRLGVTEQNMGRRSGRRGHRRPHWTLRRRMKIRSTHRRIRMIQKTRYEKIEPIRIGHAVGVSISHNLPAGRLPPYIPRHRQTPIRLHDVLHQWEFRHDRLRGILRTIIHQNYLIVRVVQFLQRFQATSERPRPVITADHHRNLRHTAEGEFIY